MTGEQCSQTSKAISCPGQKLNNGRPCMPFRGLQTQGAGHPRFLTPYVGPLWGGRGSARTTASRLGGRAFSREQEVKKMIVDLSGSSKFSLTRQMKQTGKLSLTSCQTGGKNLKVSIWYQLTLWLLLLIPKHKSLFFVPYYFLYVGINKFFPTVIKIVAYQFMFFFCFLYIESICSLLVNNEAVMKLIKPWTFLFNCNTS